MTIATARPADFLVMLLCAGAWMLGATAPAAAEPGAAPVAAFTAGPAASAVASGSVLQLAQATPRSQDRRDARRAPAPQACTRLKGVERRICVECEGVQLFKRIGCQQRVFWTACKGKRLFEDPYCQAHQDQGPPRGEGG